ncbi:MAG TPA: rRNA maturation RNase YbeY [Clostridiales bacterium]|nr:rRNA maturation RNase YbeY [Clostridiales bacterium]
MSVLIDNRQNIIKITPDVEAFVNKIINAVLEFENFDSDYEVSISFVDNDEIKELNRQYRNIDATTDVLSFPLLEFDRKSNNEPVIKDVLIDTEISLGDIVISTEKVIEQAKEYGHSQDRELAFLLVHGMLHLLGYDHIQESDEKIMFKKQEEILNLLNIKR